MRLTKEPVSVNSSVAFKIANRGCCVCPYCESTDVVLTGCKPVIVNMSTETFPRTTIIEGPLFKESEYRCGNCLGGWVSEPYNVNL